MARLGTKWLAFSQKGPVSPIPLLCFQTYFIFINVFLNIEDFLDRCLNWTQLLLLKSWSTSSAKVLSMDPKFQSHFCPYLTMTGL